MQPAGCYGILQHIKRNQDCKPSCPCERVIPLGHACQKSPCSRHESRLQTASIPCGKMIWYEEFCKFVCTLEIQTMWVGPCAGRSTWPAVSAGARRCKRGRSLLLLLLLPRLCVWVHVHRGDSQTSPLVAHNIQRAVRKSRRQHANCRQLVHTQERHSTAKQVKARIAPDGQQLSHEHDYDSYVLYRGKCCSVPSMSSLQIPPTLQHRAAERKLVSHHRLSVPPALHPLRAGAVRSSKSEAGLHSTACSVPFQCCLC